MSVEIMGAEEGVRVPILTQDAQKRSSAQAPEDKDEVSTPPRRLHPDLDGRGSPSGVGSLS